MTGYEMACRERAAELQELPKEMRPPICHDAWECPECDAMRIVETGEMPVRPWWAVA